MSKYYNFSAQHLPINERQVEQVLDRTTSYFYPEFHDVNFKQRISELNTLYLTLKEQEEALYKILRVDNINDLLKEINSYQGLLSLNGAKLANQLAKDFEDYNENSLLFYESLQKIVQSKGFQQSVLNTAFSQNDITNIINAINIDNNTNFSLQNNRGMSKLLGDIVIKGGIAYLKSLSQKDFSSDFKKHLTKVFLNGDIQSTNDGANVIFGKNLQSYSGWGKNNESKIDEQQEKNIKKSLYNLCKKYMENATQEELNALSISIQSIPIESLYANKISDLQGAIGEVVSSAYLYLLSKNHNIPIQAGKKITRKIGDKYTNIQGGIDIILNNFGFQVKNYNEFAYGAPNTIELKDEKLLSTWSKQLEINGAMEKALDFFYGVKGFNIKATNKYTLSNRIAQIDSQMDQVFLPYSDKLLEISNELSGTDFYSGTSLEGRFYKTFWIMSGKFIPSSYILKNILDYFSSKVTWNDFSLKVTSSYSGTTYENFLDNSKYRPLYSEVIPSTKITMAWQFHLEAIINNLIASQ